MIKETGLNNTGKVDEDNLRVTAHPKKAIVIYLAFTLLFSSIIWWLTLHATQQGRIAGRYMVMELCGARHLLH